jgi:hypothetical protein
MMRWRNLRATPRARVRLGVLLTATLIVGLAAGRPLAARVAAVPVPKVQTSQEHFGPGARTLLDAHNAYPERGRWADRLDRALATGLPLAIEQDLHWGQSRRDAPSAPLVAHDDDALGGAPTLEAYFFERIRPIMERALAENRREQWPLIVLNLDFKDNRPEHLDAVWALLGKYESWLSTAPRTADGAPAPLRVGPLLVLCGSDTAQRRRFHDDVAVGEALRAFGAVTPAPVAGRTKGQRVRRTVRMTAAQHIPRAADNYARWVNFPWSVVEEGGQPDAGAWTVDDSARLAALVQRAHAQQLWIRFYTLDGFGPTEDQGFSAGYNFGTLNAARARWRATITAGVDFIATDQYPQFAALHRELARR